MKHKINTRVLCGTMMAFVFSATCWAEYEDYVQHVSSDALAEPSFSDNASGKWQTNGVAQAEWPCAGMKFYVPGPGMGSSAHVLFTSNRTISAGSNMTLTFPGDELVLAGRLQPLLKRSAIDATNAFLRIPSLTMLPNGGVYYANAQAAGLEGVCTIKGTSSQPSFWFVSVVGGSTYSYCNLDFTGEASAVFRFHDDGKDSNSFLTWFCYGGDASAFYGTIRVQDPFALLRDNTATGLNFPGTLSLSGKAIFEVPTGRTATLANLSDAGGMLFISGTGGSYGNLIVTNSFSGTPPYLFQSAFAADAEDVAILTLGPEATGTFSPDDFILTNRVSGAVPSVFSACPEAFYANVTNNVRTIDGARIFSAGHRKAVWQDVGDSSSQSVLLPEWKSHWSDDSEMSPENDYYIGLGKSLYTQGTIFVTNCLLSYCGASGNIFMNKHTLLTVDDFRWYAKSNSNNIQFWGESSAISGKVTVVKCGNYRFTMQGWTRQILTFAAELCGGGDLKFTSHTSSSGDPGCSYALTGLNTNFAGRIEVSRGPFTGTNAPDRNADPSNSNYCITLKISDGRSLGGALPAFDKDGFKLASHAVLKVSGSTAFNEPTRGWHIAEVGRISVESGKTVAITNTQITYSGEFRKEGNGTLKLGGTARFTAAALETPLAGTNVLAIAGGAFMPTDTTCCDGLAV